MFWKHRASRRTSLAKSAGYGSSSSIGSDKIFEETHFSQNGTSNTLYKPLSSKEVRLLHLLPPRKSYADLHSQHPSWSIQCELVNANLDACQDYEALSYTWGGSGAEPQIEINGRKIKVRSNLAHALAALQGPDTRVLWVDALCINQIDTLERNSQVALMGEIYRRARRVLTWLGVHPLSFVTEAIHLIKKLGNCPPVSMLPPEPPSTNVMDTAAYVTWMDAVLDQRGENPLKSQDSALDHADYKWFSLLERWEELRREQQIHQRMTMRHLESLQKLESQRQRMAHRRDLVPLLKELRRRIDGCLAGYQLKASSILYDLPMKVGVQLKKQEHIGIRSTSDTVKDDLPHIRETDALTGMGHQFGTFLPQLYTSSEALLQTLLNENLQGRIRRYDSQALSKLGKLIQGLRERGICLQYLADQQHRLEREYNDWDHAVMGVELQLQRLRKTLEDHSEQIRILQHNLVETWHHLRWKEVGDWKECIFDKETKFSTDSSNMDLLFLANLFDLPYWSRLWIVQEVLLAKKIVLCFSDDARTTQDWEILTAARKSVEGIPAAWETDTTIAILTSLARECLPFRLDRQRECRDEGWSFQSLVMMTEKLLCQDPRDKIYGLLGLVQTNDQVEFDINYAKPMHDLY